MDVLKRYSISEIPFTTLKSMILEYRFRDFMWFVVTLFSKDVQLIDK